MFGLHGNINCFDCPFCCRCPRRWCLCKWNRNCKRPFCCCCPCRLWGTPCTASSNGRQVSIVCNVCLPPKPLAVCTHPLLLWLSCLKSMKWMCRSDATGCKIVLSRVPRVTVSKIPTVAMAFVSGLLEEDVRLIWSRFVLVAQSVWGMWNESTHLLWLWICFYLESCGRQGCNVSVGLMEFHFSNVMVIQWDKLDQTGISWKALGNWWSFQHCFLLNVQCCINKQCSMFNVQCSMLHQQARDASSNICWHRYLCWSFCFLAQWKMCRALCQRQMCLFCCFGSSCPLR